MDYYGWMFIGFGVGLIAEKFFKVTDKIRKAIRSYQENQKKPKTNQPCGKHNHSIKSISKGAVCSRCGTTIEKIIKQMETEKNAN